MFLREYIYVDLDKVAALASQLYEGVPERITEVKARHERIETDLKILGSGRDLRNEKATERSFTDVLFKQVELDLEAEGILNDISGDLASGPMWDAAGELIEPGTIVRVTAPGRLFHPQQMNEALIGLATSAVGLSTLSSTADEHPKPPPHETEAQEQGARTLRESTGNPIYPEDRLPALESIPLLDIPREMLAGMIRLVRGAFRDGVHLLLSPAGSDGPSISARLEEGRRFLDSSPDVLMSRYGLGEQYWTVVGIVGHIGTKPSGSLKFDALTTPDGSLNRANFVGLVSEFIDNTAGFVDVPQHPGFSLIPIALYRAVGQPRGRAEI